MASDEWCLVKSEDELRPGMCVELRPCGWCNKRERLIISDVVPAKRYSVYPDGTRGENPPGSRSFVFATPRCREFGPGKRGRLIQAIKDGRLYRLRDDDTAADEIATTRRKERVK